VQIAETARRSPAGVRTKIPGWFPKRKICPESGLTSPSLTARATLRAADSSISGGTRYRATGYSIDSDKAPPVVPTNQSINRLRLTFPLMAFPSVSHIKTILSTYNCIAESFWPGISCTRTSRSLSGLTIRPEHKGTSSPLLRPSSSASRILCRTVSL